MWLRCDSGVWRKVVVDVKVTSTDDINKAFNEKDEKYSQWATSETREKKVAKAVMVPLIVSHDGAVHKDTIRRWKDFAPDIIVDWTRMAQNVLRYNVVIVGKFFNKGSWVSEAWRKEHPEEFAADEIGTPERMETGEERRERLRLNQEPQSTVCAVFGHATPTECSVDVCWEGTFPNSHRKRTNQPT